MTQKATSRYGQNCSNNVFGEGGWVNLQKRLCQLNGIKKSGDYEEVRDSKLVKFTRSPICHAWT